MFIVVMGVAGSGKTTLGSLLATSLGWTYFEGDEYHPEENISKMAAGVALNDDDRLPWLHALARLIHDHRTAGHNGVLACSALKASYRRVLDAGGGVTFVFLRVTPELSRQRLKARGGHFMPAALVESQFDDLQVPRRGLRLDASQPAHELVTQVRSALGL